MSIAAVILVLAVGGYFLYRRADIRLVLILAAAALYFVRAMWPDAAGHRFDQFANLFLEFGRGLVQASSVIPICSAMGFAYVCKATECDAHLVHALVRPLQYVRWALIPGGIVVAFVVNSAIVSQTSTVSVVGPVLIPLLLAAGIRRETAGALLLLGGSMGGELLNPAAVEVTRISDVTGVTDHMKIVWSILPYNVLACGVAMLVFWLLSATRERRGVIEADEDVAAEHSGVRHEATAGFNSGIEESVERPATSGVLDRQSTETLRISPAKAVVPLVPIMLLMFVRRLLPMPPALTTSKDNPIGEQVTILAAMLVGVVCAGLTTPRKTGRLAAAFFEGAGFAFTYVISVIAAATMFAKAIEALGLINVLTKHLGEAPWTITVASLLIAWVMAMVTGTAVGTAPLVIAILVPIAMRAAMPGAEVIDGKRIGAVNAIAAQFGRTTSPVAPVVIMCATLCRSRPLTMAKRAAIPLICGGAVLLVAAWMRAF